MRTFALLFAFISLVLLAQFVLYLVLGSGDPVIAAFIFASFLGCLVPALLLLKPFELPAELKRRREERRRRLAGRMEKRSHNKNDER